MKKSFVIKGNICYTQNMNKLDLHSNSYVVCVDGLSKGVFETLPLEYSNLPIYDYSDMLIFVTRSPSGEASGTTTCISLQLPNPMRVQVPS